MVLKVKHQLVPVLREGYVTVFSLLLYPHQRCTAISSRPGINHPLSEVSV